MWPANIAGREGGKLHPPGTRGAACAHGVPRFSCRRVAGDPYPDVTGPARDASCLTNGDSYRTDLEDGTQRTRRNSRNRTADNADNADEEGLVSRPRCPRYPRLFSLLCLPLCALCVLC